MLLAVFIYMLWLKVNHHYYFLYLWHFSPCSKTYFEWSNTSVGILYQWWFYILTSSMLGMLLVCCLGHILWIFQSLAVPDWKATILFHKTGRMLDECVVQLTNKYMLSHKKIHVCCQFMNKLILYLYYIQKFMLYYVILIKSYYTYTSY